MGKLQSSAKHRLTFRIYRYASQKAYDSGWKTKVRTRIRRSDGVIALISKNSLSSSGQKWELACETEEGKKILGIWAYSDDRTNIPGVNTKTWTWPNIESFMNSL